MEGSYRPNEEPLKLADFLASNPADPTIAPPLVHVTEGGNLYSILKDGALDPERCNITGDDQAVYMFVGKPAYKLKPKAQCEYWEAPVVFIFKGLAYSKVSHMHAFDTGAMAEGRYFEILGTKQPSEYEMPAASSAAAALVAAFFGDRERYLRSDALTKSEMREKFNLLPGGFKILALAALYSSRRSKHLDDRKATMEARSYEQVPVSSSFLAGIVLPEEWMSDYSHIRDPLEGIGCQIEEYELYPLNRSHYVSELYRLSKRIIDNAS